MNQSISYEYKSGFQKTYRSERFPGTALCDTDTQNNKSETHVFVKSIVFPRYDHQNLIIGLNLQCISNLNDDDRQTEYPINHYDIIIYSRIVKFYVLRILLPGYFFDGQFFCRPLVSLYPGERPTGCVISLLICVQHHLHRRPP